MISVVLCTYNGEKYIEAQLNSIISQTVDVDEIIVCDDKSTDTTTQILDSLRQNDTRIKVYRNDKNLGTIKNFEKAISLAKGDIIFLSDQDDVWLNNKVEIMKDFFLLNKKCLMLFTNGNLIDENNNDLESTLWEKWNFDDHFKERWRINENAFIDLIYNANKVTGATIAFRAELKNDIIPIKTPEYFWHDTWIAMHAAYRNGLFFLDRITINYRIHEKQQVGIITSVNFTDKSFVSNNNFRKYLIRKFPQYKTLILTFPKKNSLFKRVMNKMKKMYN